MIFDTDVFIAIQRRNEKALRLVEKEQERELSVQTYMELLQGAQNRRQLEYSKKFLVEYGFRTLPLTENIGHRAAIYIEAFTLSHGLLAGDAIIAATAAEHNLTLCTGNAKHFEPIKELNLKIFER